MIVVKILIVLFLAVGIFFALAGVVGILRMPDSLCRMQASTNTATLGTLGALIGVSLYGFFILHSVPIGVKKPYSETPIRGKVPRDRNLYIAYQSYIFSFNCKSIQEGRSIHAE